MSSIYVVHLFNYSNGKKNHSYNAGWFRILTNAEFVIENFSEDLAEQYYNYAVIEYVEEGLGSKSEKVAWYKFYFDVDNKFIRIDEPEEFKQLCNFSMG